MKKWTPLIIAGLLLEIIALVCILISIFVYKGNNIFLNIGLLCVFLGGILNLIRLRKNK